MYFSGKSHSRFTSPLTCYLSYYYDYTAILYNATYHEYSLLSEFTYRKCTEIITFDNSKSGKRDKQLYLRKPGNITVNGLTITRDYTSIKLMHHFV